MTLESERLRYERITRHHAVELEDELCDPFVYEHLEDRQTPTPSELFESFAKREIGAPTQRCSESWFDFAARSKETGQLIGRIEATLIESRAEVAYLFGRRHWGFGYAFEAVQWLQAFLAKEHAAKEYWATVAPGNERSITLIKRLGYTEAPQAHWPAKLTGYVAGDCVYHCIVGSERAA